MATSFERKLEAAKEAVRVLASDTTVSPARTIEALDDVWEEIDSRQVALKATIAEELDETEQDL